MESRREGEREGKGGDNDTALPTVMKICLVVLNRTNLLTRKSGSSYGEDERSDTSQRALVQICSSSFVLL